MGHIIAVGRMAKHDHDLLDKVGAKVRLLGEIEERKRPNYGHLFFGMAFIELPEGTLVETYENGLENLRDLIGLAGQGPALREYGKVFKITFQNGLQFVFVDAFDKQLAELFLLPWPPKDDF